MNTWLVSTLPEPALADSSLHVCRSDLGLLCRAGVLDYPKNHSRTAIVKVFLMLRSGTTARLLIALSLALAAGFPGAQPAHAQVSSQISGPMRMAEAELKSYFKAHGHLPRSTQEKDDFLARLYKTANLNSPPPTVKPFNLRTWRVLGSYAINVDGAARSASLDLWRRTPPKHWWAKACTLAITTDGDHDYYIWTPDLEGYPLRDEHRQALLLGGSLR